MSSEKPSPEAVARHIMQIAEALRQELPQAISLDVATLCAGCRTVHDQPAGACPRCTDRGGILVDRLLRGRLTAVAS